MLSKLNISDSLHEASSPSYRYFNVTLNNDCYLFLVTVLKNDTVLESLCLIKQCKIYIKCIFIRLNTIVIVYAFEIISLTSACQGLVYK